MDKTWKRYAFEGFMREEDKRYWKQTQELVGEKTKRITVIIAAITAIQVITFSYLIFFRLRK